MSVKTPRPRKYNVDKWDSSKLWCPKCGFGKRSCKCKKKRSKKK